MVLDSFTSIPGKICFFSSSADIMRFLGYDVHECYLAALTTALNVHRRVYYGLYEVGGLSFTLDIDVYKKCFRSIGWEINYGTNYSYEDFIDTIKENIVNGHPLMMCVDIYNLSYHPEYHKTHSGHLVTVYGIDDKNIWIADSFIPAAKIKYFKGKIPYDESIIDLSKCDSIQNMLWRLKPLKGMHGDIDELCKKNLKESIEFFLAGKDNEECGIGVFVWLRDYCIELMNNPPETIKKQLYAFHMQIGVWNGMVSIRYLLADYLEKNGYSELSKAYNSLSDNWNIVSLMLLKTMLSQKFSTLGDIAKRIDDIIIQEEKYAHILLESGLFSRMG